MPHQFTPPWTVHNNESSFWVEDATGMRFGYVYYDDRPQAGTSAMKPTLDEARRLAANIAKLPDGVLTVLDGPAREALRRFIASRSDPLTEAQAAALLIRDALIGIGDLPLGAANRGRAAGTTKAQRR